MKELPTWRRSLGEDNGANASADIFLFLRTGALGAVRSGTVGLFHPDGSVRDDVVEAVVSAVGVDTTVFEAPRKEQQAWLIRRFGPDVNLANVPPGDALGVEALRLGLRADTFDAGVRATR